MVAPYGVEPVEGVEPSPSVWKTEVLTVIRHRHMYLGDRELAVLLFHNAAPHCYFGNRLTVSPRGVLRRALVLGLRVPTVFRGKEKSGLTRSDGVYFVLVSLRPP